MACSSENWFPESEWFQRNLEMLRRSQHPEEYLDAVQQVRGRKVAQALRKAWRENPSSPSQHALACLLSLQVGEQVTLPQGHPSSLRKAARRFGEQHGLRFSARNTKVGPLVLVRKE